MSARGWSQGDAFDRQRLIATVPKRIAEGQAKLSEMEAMRTVTLAPARSADIAAPPVTDGVATTSG